MYYYFSILCLFDLALPYSQKMNKNSMKNLMYVTKFVEFLVSSELIDSCLNEKTKRKTQVDLTSAC